MLPSLAGPVHVWILTDRAGTIVEACEVAPRVLNLSARGLIGRTLPLFFIEDRPTLYAQLAAAALGDPVERTTVIQPRERKPVAAVVELRRAAEGDDMVEWSIQIG